MKKKTVSFLEAIKPSWNHLRIMLIILLITILDAFIRIRGRDYLFFPENYLLRPVTPLFHLILPYSWINAHNTLFNIVVIILTLFYWYILASLILFLWKLITNKKVGK